jgi:hypothetical protein
VQVLVARIEKSSKRLGCLHFYTRQVVSNSHILVFYSEQSHVTLYGNATNWNGSGWQEVYEPLCKFRVKVFTNNIIILTGKYKDKCSYRFLYKFYILGG